MTNKYRYAIRYGFLVLFLIGEIAFAQERVITSRIMTEEVDGQSRYRVFLVNKSKVVVFESATAESGNVMTLALGDLYFATKEQNDRYSLAKYDDFEDKLEELGWVDVSDLLSRRTPLIVGESRRLGLNVVRPGQVSSLNLDNTLPVRCVSKPDVAAIPVGKPGGEPDNNSENKLNGWSWYYVYGVFKNTESGSQPEDWVLIANSPQLIDQDVQSTEVDEAKAATSRLLGWVKLKDVELWCSNFVLEYNTSANAVAFRQEHAPAKVYRVKDTEGAVQGTEPLDAYIEQEGVRLLRLDPFGMDREYPRLHVLDKQDAIAGGGFWLRVASVGSTNAQVDPVKITRMIIALNDIQRKLRQVDVCFAVDASGSMEKEINAVRAFAKELAARLKRLGTTGQKQVMYLGTALKGEGDGDRDDRFVLDTTLDIHISLISFQDPGGQVDGPAPWYTKKHFAGYDLVERGLGPFPKKEDLRGGRAGEPIHAALLRACTEPGIWRKDSTVRVLICIADEPGKAHGGVNAETVRLKMPDFPESSLSNTPKLKDIPVATRKKMRTKIIGMYCATDEERDDENTFAKFHSNLASLVETPGTANNPGSDIIDVKTDQKNQLLAVQKYVRAIVNKQQSVIKNSLKTLEDTINGEKIQPSALLLSDVALNDRISENPEIKNLEELRQASTVAFFRGYVPFGGAKPDEEPYRVRLLFERTDLEYLASLSKDVGRAINQRFDSKLSDKRSRDRQIAELYIAALTDGIGQRLTPQEIAEKADKLLNDVGTTAVELLGISRSIPLRPDGFLRTRFIDILRLQPKEIKSLGFDLHRKGLGLTRISEGFTVPESFEDILNSEKAPKIRKYWFHKPQDSYLEFCYVPESYLP